ncbi:MULTISPECIES: ADP-ribosyltransferase [unclassified Clostridioides]|uniref:ADP-ribosyltransferase n=1 Tax=unclassified Clostridioides TaxID=2635829 RepID=UPI00255A05FD|nr:ADP-ribosyltransferase [Clostridioides sp. ES-S-0107-01]
MSEPDKSDSKPTPLFVHLKLPKGTGILPYQNGESVSTLIEQGYSIKVDKTLRVVIGGKQYIKIEASLVSSLDFKDEVVKGDEWAKEAYKDWATSLNASQIDALQYYMVAQGYKGINDYLIKNETKKDPDSRLDAYISNIDSALKIKPLTSNLTVYRRAGAAEFGLNLSSSEYNFNLEANVNTFKEKWEGKTLTYPNFVSTSIGSVNMSGFAPRRIVLRIMLPKGSSGTYVSSFPGAAGEFEFLLNHGSKLKINKVDTYKDGTTTKLIVDTTLLNE